MLKMASESFIRAFFVVFRSFSRFLNSREFKFTVAFELFAFATTWLSTKRISLVYVFHRRSSDLFKLFSAKRGQHSESFQSSPNYKPHARLICVQWKFTQPHRFAHLRFFFFSTVEVFTCSKVINAFKRWNSWTDPFQKALRLSH